MSESPTGSAAAAPTPVSDALRAADAWNPAWDPFAALDPAWTEAATRAGLPLKPLVGPAYREAALGSVADLQALWTRRPWRE